MTAAAGPSNFSAGNVTAPAYDGFAITPSNVANLPTMARGIYVGGAGDIALTTPGNTALTFVGLTAGSILPVMAIKVSSSGTSATFLIGLI